VVLSYIELSQDKLQRTGSRHVNYVERFDVRVQWFEVQ
jgi:hypothetical protein